MKVLGKIADLIIYLAYAAFWLLSALVLIVSLATTVVFRQYEQNDLFDFVGENLPLLLLSMLAVFALMLAARAAMERRESLRAVTIPLSDNNDSRPCGRGSANLTSDAADASGTQPEEKSAKAVSPIRSASDLRAPFPWLVLTVAGAVSLFLVLAVRGLPTADAAQLDEIIQQFLAGDYSGLTSGYLCNYPFQTFYVYFGEIIARLFGEYDNLAWQILNVIAIEFEMYFLYQITWELFESRRVCLIMQILSCGAFCLYAFSTFIYLDLLSMTLQTAAIYLQILYMKRERVRYEVGAGLCISIAVLMKMNCLIALIAMILFLIVDAIWKSAGRRLGKALLLSAMLIALTWAGSELVELYTYWRTGMTIPEGFPTICYFAMGLQMTEGKCGWYNGSTISIWAESGNDVQKATELAWESIRESIAEFRNSGRYMLNFFYQKFISQWGDSTCVSMRELENTYRHTEETALASWLIFGMGGTIMQWIMNVFHSMIYLGNLLYAGAVLLGKRGREGCRGAKDSRTDANRSAEASVNCRNADKVAYSSQNDADERRDAQACGVTGEGASDRKTSPGAAADAIEGRKRRGLHRFGASEAMIVIFIFGGMLFHELWEASGRYTMRYYLTMLPLAAWGWSLAADFVLKKISARRGRS